MKQLLILSGLITCLLGRAQSNTATTSGSVGKCAVWGYPYTLYNNSGATQTVSSGVTVTVDQNRNAGAIVLSGSGAMDMSGANGITMSGSGSEINCKWDIPAAGSHTVVNNNGVFSTTSLGDTTISLSTPVIFTAPYNGKYTWIQGTGWSASMSGSAIRNGGFGLHKSGNDVYGNIYFQNTAGTCGTPPTAPQGPTWFPTIDVGTMVVGRQLNYAASTAWTNGSTCNDTTLNFTLGNSTILFEN